MAAYEKVKAHKRRTPSGKYTSVRAHTRKVSEDRVPPSVQRYAKEKGEPPFQITVAYRVLSKIAERMEDALGAATASRLSGIHSDEPIISVDPGASNPYVFDFHLMEPVEDYLATGDSQTKVLVWSRKPHTKQKIKVISARTFETIKEAVEHAKRWVMR